MRLFVTEMKHAIISRRFILCVLVYALLLCLSIDRNSAIGVMYQFQFIYATGFYMLFLICATLPFADSFWSEYSTGTYKEVVEKVGIYDYLRTKVVITVISGSLSILLASLILISYLFCRFPTYTVGISDYDGYGVLINNDHYLPYLVIRVLLTCAIGSIFSSFSLMCSPFLKNRFAINVFPFIAFYIYNEFINFGAIPQLFNLTRMLYTPNDKLGGILPNVIYSLALSILLDNIFGYVFIKKAGRMLDD